jgi:hypothetical protein
MIVGRLRPRALVARTVDATRLHLLGALVLAACVLVSAACDSSPRSIELAGASGAPAPPRAPGAPAGAPASTGARPGASDGPEGAEGAVADAAPNARYVELLGLVLTSGIASKDPVDVVEQAKAGERVYAHLTIRNRTGRPREVVLRFHVEGVERANVPLEIGESWSWRSWGYATPRPADVGKKLTIELVDDEGRTLAERTLPVRAR